MSITGTIFKSISDYNHTIQRSVGSKLRVRRITPLLEIIEAVFKESGQVSIIDIGGTEKYWGIIPRQYLDEHNVNITIVNLPGKASIEDHGPFRFIEADACNLKMIGDNSFHIAHSTSVVEHVGDWARMVQFSKELSRVSKHYYVQTPNYWFPVEPHCMTPFFHWLPKPSRLWLVSHFQLGHWNKAASTDEAARILERARLLNKKMFQALFEEAAIMTERFWGLPKSFIAVKR